MHPFFELRSTLRVTLHPVSFTAPSQPRCTPLSRAVFYWAMPKPFWAIPHPTELSCTLLTYPPPHPNELCSNLFNYAALTEQYCTSQSAMLHLTELYAAPHRATLHLTELCCTQQSYAAPNRARCTLLSYGAPYWATRNTLWASST